MPCIRSSQPLTWRPDVTPDEPAAILQLSSETAGVLEFYSQSPNLGTPLGGHQSLIYESLLSRNLRNPQETADLVVLETNNGLGDLTIPDSPEAEKSVPVLPHLPEKKTIVVARAETLTIEQTVPPALPKASDPAPPHPAPHTRSHRSISPLSGTKPGSTTSHSKSASDEAPLQALSDFLDVLFQSRRQQRKVSLTPAENQILRSIVRRKYGSESNLLSADTTLADLSVRLQSTNSNKRPEENYKFIFKRCLKHMKEKFKRDHPALAKRKDLDKLFYEHYFRQVSDSQKISIDNFYHPKNSKIKNKVGPKTINNTYIQNICKSRLFKQDFSEYLDRQLLGEYQESIKLKIKNLISRWSKELRTSSNREEAVRGICKYIEENKKCKLPWSVKEVTEAIRAVNQLFDLAHPKAS